VTVPLGNRVPLERPMHVGAQVVRTVPETTFLAEELDERELLRRAGERDEAAVRALYREHVGRVHRHVARILGPSDPDVEDVVQKVFLAALSGAGSFDGRSRVSTWILGIATRRALDEARARWRRGRWGRVSERVGMGRAAGRPDISHEAASAAQQALARLRPDQRPVFVLHEVEGHALAEIQQMTGVGISTLHARLKAARKRLDAVADELQLHEGGGDGPA